MIDPVAVPDWLEQPVAETECHDALNGVLSQKVVDAENLVFVQRAQDLSVQLAGRAQAMAEWLLDDHATPKSLLPILVLVLIGEFRVAELVHHGAEELIGNREIEDDVALGAMRLFGIVKSTAKRFVQFGLGQIALDIRHFLRKPLPSSLIDVIDIKFGHRISDKAFQPIVNVIAPAFRSSRRSRHADQRKFFRQHLGAREIVQCGNHQAFGEVARGAEDYHGAGIGRFGLPCRRALNKLCGVVRSDRSLDGHRATPLRFVTPRVPAVSLSLVRDH